MGTRSHRSQSPTAVRVAVVSVSTTRSIADDRSGRWIAEEAGREGHPVVGHHVVPDDRQAVAATVRRALAENDAQAVLVTGGTGVSPRDVTIEALLPLFDKQLTAFAPLFAQLSFAQIDSAALLSRATAGTMEGGVVFCMPGSLRACKLACRELIFPELSHLVGHLLEA